jgi:hypothetical protein
MTTQIRFPHIKSSSGLLSKVDEYAQIRLAQRFEELIPDGHVRDYAELARVGTVSNWIDHIYFIRATRKVPQASRHVPTSAPV